MLFFSLLLLSTYSAHLFCYINDTFFLEIFKERGFHCYECSILLKSCRTHCTCTNILVHIWQLDADTSLNSQVLSFDIHTLFPLYRYMIQLSFLTDFQLCKALLDASLIWGRRKRERGKSNNIAFTGVNKMITI